MHWKCLCICDMILFWYWGWIWMFGWITRYLNLSLCLCFCLDLIIYVAALNMFWCHVRWMLRFSYVLFSSLFALWIDKYVCLGTKMPCCLLDTWCVCVCVCEFRTQVLYLFLIRLGFNTQRWEANLRIGQSWVPNTFSRVYLNSEPVL